MKQYIMALDQGTTSSRALLLNRQGDVCGVAQKEFLQRYPQPGWVEHDPMEIWGTQSGVAREVLEKTGIRPEEIAAIGITNQRETTVVWHRETGRPVHHAIVWQCRRTAEMCDRLKEQGLEETIKRKTGLVVDAYFSGTKIKWILDHVPGAREMAAKGDLLFGTIDTWLIWNLTRGEVHATDYSNASRTMLFNIHTGEWDEELLALLDIPPAMMPEVKNSSGIYGYTDPHTFGGARIPISGVAGDQQAALFGQTCFRQGMVKNTYGTGCFLLMNTGETPIPSSHGLLTTIAWGIDGQLTYALEGSIFVAGAVIQWLRDELRLIRDAAETEAMALKVPDNGGVYLVPAFVGLGAPHWDMYARGTMVGLTRGTKAEHLVRAALESIAYQTCDILEAMADDADIIIPALKVDGGAAQNDFLMQFQADMLQVPVLRPLKVESTAQGAAFLAGLAVGFWQNQQELSLLQQEDHIFEPAMEPVERKQQLSQWRRAVQRSLQWEQAE
ncbi:glycerol kinase GlpK [Anoxynatronum buryatiense]|uniref:Glycerol kinase n=1 Tax=Anoxynatronum buryatiense TaxID=489973 RepID=A0AA45WYA7_9CLOT|nr:glycerol kinase GlpK [Anoxynatronum buryatiense]SMP67359.1 glycerol kinase [Anoxynatronum buryatiense]